MAEKKNNITESVFRLASPLAEELGLRIWDVFYGKEGQEKILRITIDKDGGIFIDDCEKLSRAFDPVLDEANLIPDNAYRFEVSSPGLGRRIHTDAQFEAYVGKSVLVKLIHADEDGRDHKGILTSFDSSSFTIRTQTKEKNIQRNSVSYVKADDDIDF